MERCDYRWDEFRQIGTDYESAEEVACYDKRMRDMRDIDGENREIMEMLRLKDGSRVLEIGVGTGAFVRLAAKKYKLEAVGLDVSPAMLEYAGKMVKEENLTGITLQKGSFLTYDYPERYFDGVLTSMAFHHLPDGWKPAALENICRTLKTGGRFVLLDVVFNWKKDGGAERYFERIVDAVRVNRPNLARHIAQEFSTQDWIIEGMLERAGFAIESKKYEKDFIATYCAIKK